MSAAIHRCYPDSVNCPCKQADKLVANTYADLGLTLEGLLGPQRGKQVQESIAVYVMAKFEQAKYR